MAIVLINPGTEGRKNCTLRNAEAIARAICEDLSIAPDRIVRKPEEDRPADGFFGFEIVGCSKGPVPLDIPGDDPEEFLRSQPFVSRRMYVDGSSWLYGFALGIIEEML